MLEPPLTMSVSIAANPGSDKSSCGAPWSRNTSGPATDVVNLALRLRYGVSTERRCVILKCEGIAASWVRDELREDYGVMSAVGGEHLGKPLITAVSYEGNRPLSVVGAGKRSEKYG